MTDALLLLISLAVLAVCSNRFAVYRAEREIRRLQADVLLLHRELVGLERDLASARLSLGARVPPYWPDEDRP